MYLLQLCSKLISEAFVIIEIIGYIGALFIGVSLGLIGGGGSILAVPILAYLFHVDAKLATAYSLFVVGLSALLGGIKQHIKGYVSWRTVLVFGLPAIIGVTTIRKYIIPKLPEVLFQIENFHFTLRMGMFGLFVILMIPAGISMLKEVKEKTITGAIQYHYLLILIEGLLVGAITGFVGAGGGFLIIPALVILANVKMKTAIGTSLVIIAVKSLSGFFIGDAFNLAIDWAFLGMFTAVSIVGIIVGSYLGNFIDGKKLKKGFGIFIFIMAAFMFYMEFFVKH